MVLLTCRFPGDGGPSFLVAMRSQGLAQAPQGPRREDPAAWQLAPELSQKPWQP